MNEVSWYNMMGLSKIFLRNFIIGCFLLCIMTIITLASTIDNLIKARLFDQIQYRLELTQVRKDYENALKERTESDYKIINEALENQKKMNEQLQEWKQSLLKK